MFHVYKFLKEDTGSGGNDVDVPTHLPGVSNYKFISSPSLIGPFDYRTNQVLKRITDIFFAAIAIVFILSWLIPIIAVLIKLDSKGPVFFRQKRNKRNGRIFTCLKFRSMVVNQDADLIPAVQNDGRITRIGKLLRNSYLDELPQFFNVLLGDMSVIGPRPHMLSEDLRYSRLIENYSYRNKAKPGITGLAQVMGFAGPTGYVHKMQDRVNIDIFYIRNWSLKLDFAILYHTLLKTFN